MGRGDAISCQNNKDPKNQIRQHQTHMKYRWHHYKCLQAGEVLKMSAPFPVHHKQTGESLLMKDIKFTQKLKQRQCQEAHSWQKQVGDLHGECRKVHKDCQFWVKCLDCLHWYCVCCYRKEMTHTLVCHNQGWRKRQCYLVPTQCPLHRDGRGRPIYTRGVQIVPEMTARNSSASITLGVVRVTLQHDCYLCKPFLFQLDRCSV
jgi:hypothetical protein